MQFAGSERSGRIGRACASLNIPPGQLSEAKVKSAFMEASKMLDPDRYADAPERERQEIDARFREVNVAYGVLIEAVRRRPVPEYGSAHSPKDSMNCFLIEDMARNRNFRGIVLYLEKVFKEDAHLVRFGVSLLESRLEKILEKGDADVLMFLNRNTDSQETYASTMASMRSLGLREPYMGSLEKCKEGRRWDWIAACAGSLPREDGLRDYAARLLEENACAVVADSAKEAISFISREAASARVRRMALDALVADGDPEAVRVMFKKKELEGDWDGILARCSEPGLERYGLRILERNASRVAGRASSDCLVFVGAGTEDEGIRERMVRALAKRGDLDGAKIILDVIAESGRWEELAVAAEAHERLRRYAVGIMERELGRIVESGDIRAMAFLYGNSRRDDMGSVLVKGLLGKGREKEACTVLGWMAKNGEWPSLMEESEMPENPDDIRAHAFYLLEQNRYKVLQSRSMDIVRYLVGNTEDGRALEDILLWSYRTDDAASARSALERMAELKMWDLLLSGVKKTGWNRKMHGQAMGVLSRNAGGICLEGDCGSIIGLWKVAESDETRSYALRALSGPERPEEAKRLLETIAKAKQYEWLEYFEWIAKSPELKAYASSLIGKKR